MADAPNEKTEARENSAANQATDALTRIRDEAYSSASPPKSQADIENRGPKINANASSSSLPELAVTGVNHQEVGKPAKEDRGRQISQSDKPASMALTAQQRRDTTYKPENLNPAQQRSYKDEAGNTVTEFKNDPEQRSKETQFYNDRDKHDYPQGAKQKETDYLGRDDGLSKKTEYPNRTESAFHTGSRDEIKVINYDPSSTLRPNGEPQNLSKVVEAPGRYKRSEYDVRKGSDEMNMKIEYFPDRKDGKETFKSYANGREESFYKDGSYSAQNPDGATETFDKSGRNGFDKNGHQIK